VAGALSLCLLAGGCAASSGTPGGNGGTQTTGTALPQSDEEVSPLGQRLSDFLSVSAPKTSRRPASATESTGSIVSHPDEELSPLGQRVSDALTGAPEAPATQTATGQPPPPQSQVEAPQSQPQAPPPQPLQQAQQPQVQQQQPQQVPVRQQPAVQQVAQQSSPPPPRPVAGSPGDVTCPQAEVRQGASTLAIAPPGGNPTLSLQYQGTFVRIARECAVVGGEMVMKIGVQGRLIVGPAGGPGQVDVPLRIAVVEETASGMRPIVTKLIRLPVTIASGQDGAVFSHVEQGVSFPLPNPVTGLDDYIAYVGFDPLAAQAQDHQRPKPKSGAKAKPRPQS
jgi:hypothetical protein